MTTKTTTFSAPPFFVVGCDRSGTTLLRIMLNEHSKIDVPNESDFISVIVDRSITDDDLRDPESCDQLLDEILAVKRLRDWDLDKSAILERMMVNGTSVKGMTQSIFETHMLRNNKTRWGDKTPRYTRYIDNINYIFDDALFLHIVRDGRDVASSLKKVTWFSNDIIAISRHWKNMVNFAERAELLLGSRYLQIRYEDLVREPENVLRRVCDFLGEEYDAQMLNYWASNNIQFNEMWRGDHDLLKSNVSTERVGKWNKDLTNIEQAVVYIVGKRELRRYGYLGDEKPRIFNILLAALWWFSWSLWQAPRNFLLKLKTFAQKHWPRTVVG